MPWDPTPLETLIHSAIPGLFPAAQVAIRQGGKLLFARAFGCLDPGADRQPVQLETCFDLASLTKLYTATACMALVETGALQLDQPVSRLLPELQGSRPLHPYEDPLQPGKWIDLEPETGIPIGVDQVSWRQLLTHTSGLPAWRPLFREPDAASARQMALHTFFSYRPGSRVVYSDIGFILLGLGLERLLGKSLDLILQGQVLQPLGLRHTRFYPGDPWNPPVPPPPCAPTEWCLWRQRRLCGQVHDENAARLGGIAPHAGLFATALEVAAFGESFLRGSLLQPETVAEMTREQVEGRGLGFALRSSDPLASSYPFSPAAFGHTGFTGTSLWIDPQRQLVVALLTNAVYHGRQDNGFQAFRVAAHQAILKGLS
ncbi:serine hydrolase domain-containing protein [Thermostichus vulcanus]|uniref:Serine hydrolase n=1 Tax=Thermostichus vulcanus str. 'Rupite' TaxID=2813851 RepID=A0ABT0C9T5_THEVL|nr:serine hydrolase [Thermostichus vulcanus str. 'Rupite']